MKLSYGKHRSGHRTHFNTMDILGLSDKFLACSGLYQTKFSKYWYFEKY